MAQFDPRPISQLGLLAQNLVQPQISDDALIGEAVALENFGQGMMAEIEADPLPPQLRLLALALAKALDERD